MDIIILNVESFNTIFKGWGSFFSSIMYSDAFTDITSVECSGYAGLLIYSRDNCMQTQVVGCTDACSVSDYRRVLSEISIWFEMRILTVVTSFYVIGYDYYSLIYSSVLLNSTF